MELQNMEFIAAFAKGEANRGQETKVFDWEKAIDHINACRKLGKGEPTFLAGLAEDWAWTGGEIFNEGKPVEREDTYTYLASTWATPVLCIRYPDGTETILECFKMENETPGWGAETYWPAGVSVES